MQSRYQNSIVPALMLGLGLLLTTIPAPAFAQDPNPQDQGVAERAGAQVDRFLNRLQRNFRDLSEDVRRRAAEVQQRVEDLGVEARVYSRIRWDKALSEAEIAIESKEGGVVILHGTVPDAELRRKAVRLAVETIGVERVQDNLTIGAAPTDDPAPAAAPR
ncbi:BON domain-containing protein [Tautonia marina]|uniref:BON domain-containing protein n=1 Tax=Tautonia marina TaxID=2653855 RepID=UPI0012604C21|nr:BON domain-containing protein [Tautonia marina]